MVRLSFFCFFFFDAATPVLRRMHTHYTQSPAGLLATLLVMAQQPATLPLLRDAPSELLPCVYRCISSPRCAQSVLDAVQLLYATSTWMREVSEGAVTAQVRSLMGQTFELARQSLQSLRRAERRELARVAQVGRGTFQRVK